MPALSNLALAYPRSAYARPSASCVAALSRPRCRPPASATTTPRSRVRQAPRAPEWPPCAADDPKSVESTARRRGSPRPAPLRRRIDVVPVGLHRRRPKRRPREHTTPAQPSARGCGGKDTDEHRLRNRLCVNDAVLDEEMPYWRSGVRSTDHESRGTSCESTNAPGSCGSRRTKRAQKSRPLSPSTRSIRRAGSAMAFDGEDWPSRMRRPP